VVPIVLQGPDPVLYLSEKLLLLWSIDATGGVVGATQ
jgi:hypothetical protein